MFTAAERLRRAAHDLAQVETVLELGRDEQARDLAAGDLVTPAEIAAAQETLRRIRGILEDVAQVIR